MSGEKWVCGTCKDSHRMLLHYDNGDVQEVMCTHCPRPCQACRAGGNGPFCEKTPCGCFCHVMRAPAETERRRSYRLASERVDEARDAVREAENLLQSAQNRLRRAEMELGKVQKEGGGP